jgi:hypothetical protein
MNIENRQELEGFFARGISNAWAFGNVQGSHGRMAHGAPGMQGMPRYFRALLLQRLHYRMSRNAAGVFTRRLRHDRLRPSAWFESG